MLLIFSHVVLPKFESDIIENTWHLVKGYLALYHKLELLHFDKPFRLGSWLNIKETQGNDDQKANLLILEMMHLLADKKYSRFLDKTERIEAYISARFKAHKYKRTRYFLRMLRSVVKGRYHSKLTAAHAEKQVKKLKLTENELDFTTIDREIVPYEILWQLVLKMLR